jgi:YVTN family beta-propeller protein/parallel beta-helix repeat protein
MKRKTDKTVVMIAVLLMSMALMSNTSNLVRLGKSSEAAQAEADAISVGPEPTQLAVNPATNMVYVNNMGSNTVQAINGSTDTVTANITVYQHPIGIAVNPTTNKVYVADPYNNAVSVINGTTNTVITTISVGGSYPSSYPYCMALNPVTDTVYVTYAGVAQVSVIDGATDTVTATISAGIGPSNWGVAVNPDTNTVYVTGGTAVYNVQVIDGATNTVTATIPVGSCPTGVAVDNETNTVYVANRWDNTVSVINGTTNTVTATISADIGNDPVSVAVNPVINTVFVANANSNTVSIIDGSTNTVTATIAVGSPADVKVNPLTYCVYVANENYNTVSVFRWPSSTGAYSVSFTESGLLSGTEWWVDLNGDNQSSGSSMISFSLPNGTYTYSTSTILAGYAASPSSGSITINGANVYQIITFVLQAITIYINSDGSVVPSSAPISSPDNITYTFTGNIDFPTYYGIVVERSNIIINGNGYTVQGNQNGNGLYWQNINNVTIENTNIKNFNYGIDPYSSYNSSISENNITTNNDAGIELDSSSNNTISGNNITTNNDVGIELDSSSNNTISGNNIANNGNGIFLYGSSNNTISGNNIANNGNGITDFSSPFGGNEIFHNNFVHNTWQVSAYSYALGDIWDDGYPSGGNYWSDYTGTDWFSGPYQNVPGSDGIGDTPYLIPIELGTYPTPDSIIVYAEDHYPLMRPWTGIPGVRDVAVTSVTANRRWLYQGFSVNISVTVLDNGDFNENVTVTLYYNTTAGENEIGTQYILIEAGQNGTLSFVWNTEGVPYNQNYTITAIATIPLGINLTNNTLSTGPITVRILGDINGDGKVDGRDITIIAGAFGSVPGDPRWNPDADINQDGKVDGRDLVLAAANFGK